MAQCGGSSATATISDSSLTIAPPVAVVHPYSMDVEDEAEVLVDETSTMNPFWNAEFLASWLMKEAIGSGSSLDDVRNTVALSIDIPSEHSVSEDDDIAAVQHMGRTQQSGQSHPLPPSFRPRKVDGKVQSEIWVVAQVSVDDYFKSNSAGIVYPSCSESEMREKISNDLEALLDSSLIKDFVLSEVDHNRIGLDFSSTKKRKQKRGI
ncbi:hypothetical protein BX616_006942 [Lobosporangium transversale]|nr:hypothetical protein BX616_006942 [Lobosporangium transversale]